MRIYRHREFDIREKKDSFFHRLSIYCGGLQRDFPSTLRSVRLTQCKDPCFLLALDIPYQPLSGPLEKDGEKFIYGDQLCRPSMQK